MGENFPTMNKTEALMRAWVKKYGLPAGEDGPVRFVREVFGAEPDEWQEEALRAYGRGERQLSFVSCHGAGKTTVAAWIINHALLFQYPMKARATAPSKQQMFGALFAEVMKWWRKLPPPIKELYKDISDSISGKEPIEQAVFEAVTARPENPEALQGVHEDPGFVLLVIDEASGVHEKIFESGSGSMSQKNATTLMLSNPTKTSGTFFKTHRDPVLSSMWHTFHLGAFRAARAAGWDGDIPEGAYDVSDRVGEHFAVEQAALWGIDSDAFKIRVLGMFPDTDDDTLIPYSWVDEAHKRDIEPPFRTVKKVWALDVARKGPDSSVLLERQGYSVNWTKAWRKLNTMELAGRVKSLWDETPERDRPTVILIDVIGIGAGVVDRLRELNLPAIGVNVGEGAAMNERFRNLRAELWWRVREFFEEKTCVIQTDKCDPELMADLVGIQKKFTSGGKIQIESKDDMKKRLGRSPDYGDALMLSFADEAAVMIGGSKASTNWNTPLKRGIKGVV